MSLPELDYGEELHVLDPCAGDGDAVLGLRHNWDTSGTMRHKVRIHACELEGERARALKDRWHTDRPLSALHADAFHLRWEDPADRGRGVDVLFLNPPYDHEPDFGRLELKFLDRSTPALVPGHGVLMFLVPFYVLGHCAEFLARHYLDHRAWRLPDEEFKHFKQALLVARRAPMPISFHGPALERLQAWADDAANLPVLPQVCDDPLAVKKPDNARTSFELQRVPLDITAALERFKPWDGDPVGVDTDATRLLGARFHTATPPKPAHIALALSAGMFNGHRLQPNDPKRHPPILAKGLFERELVEVSARHNDDGEVTATVEVEQPRLRISILRLDTYEFRTLRPGVVPTGLESMDSWNAADLLVHYDGALAQLMRTQFPPLHDPSDPRQLLDMPPSPRTPFKVQHHAISAALKLITTGQNPFLVAEVGTGKSTMGLFIALALAPQNRDRTVSELQRCGFDGPLPTVERTLILCPPHLLTSWKDQAKAVMPEARVKILRKPSDLDADADLYILSRETAKLGHRRKGLEGQCPGCGGPITTGAKTNRNRRLRCPNVRRHPANDSARFARELARILVDVHTATHKYGAVALDLVDERFLPLRSRCPDPEAAYEHLRQRALRWIERHIDHDGYWPAFGQLVNLYTLCAHGANVQEQSAQELIEVKKGKPTSHYTVHCCSNALYPIRQGTDIDAWSVLEDLARTAEWYDEVCDEPLYQATPDPRRVPLAKVIQRRYRQKFDLILADEAHEYNNMGSAQTHALHRLVGLPDITTVVLTGSLMGGYASSLFANFQALSPCFRKEMGRDDLRLFIDRYGYRKVLLSHKAGGNSKDDDKPKTYGTVTDRQVGGIKFLGEAPGILPTFLMHHLLPVSILVHKDDLDDALPPITEQPVALEPDGDPRDGEVLFEYERLRNKLLDVIAENRFTSLRGKLLGALVELPSYLDRCTEDQGPFTVRYPESEGGKLIARARTFPSDYATPKERWLLRELNKRLENNEKVIVFLRHTGTARLPERLLRLIGEQVTHDCAWLNTKKVSTAKRETWINKEILAKGVKILLVNADAVRTGLNNLVTFTTAIWHELTWSATTYRQANGRVHRIGQTRPVSVLVPYFAGTAQETGFDLVAQKVSASLQVVGLDMQAALEAAGASEESSASVATAMALGEAVYRAMTAEAGHDEEVAA